MKKYFAIIAGILIGVCIALCLIDVMSPKELGECMGEVLPYSQPGWMRIWVADCEYDVPPEQIELLWQKLQTMRGCRGILAETKDGGYVVECIYEGGTTEFAVDAKGITIEGERYCIGEEMNEWIELMREVTGVDNMVSGEEKLRNNIE